MHRNQESNSYSSNTSQGEASDACCARLKKSSILMSLKNPKQADSMSQESQSKVLPSSSQGFLPRCSNQKGERHHYKGIPLNQEKVFSTPQLLVNDCWDSNRAEAGLKLMELFKENSLEEDDLDVPIKKRRLEMDAEDDKSPPYTKEFHTLTEIQKSRILTAVEDTIKRLAVDDFYHGSEKQDRKVAPPDSECVSPERVFCKRFFLPWALMKVTEMLVCHVILIAFLSDGSYFQRENEFLPVVVTYYLTLFVIVISLLAHISCFSYPKVQNPCYFMGIISSSILMLTTTMGMLVMLSMMNYYKTYRQILVLIFVSILALLLFVELYLFYVEVKRVWSRQEATDRDYVT